MKRLTIIGILVTTTAWNAGASPVFLPQAAPNVQKGQTEVGVNAQFGYQSSEIVGSAGTTFKNRVWHVPLYARYGILDMLEAKLLIPITRAVDSSEGATSTRSTGTGIGNIQLGAKYTVANAPLPLALAVDFDLPTANSKNNPGALGWRYNNQVQQGFNAHVRLVADSPVLAELFTGHAAFGYMNTGNYKTTADQTFNPGDLVTFGASVDMSLKKWLENLTFSGEFVGNSALNHSKTASIDNGNDKGTVLEAGPALRYDNGRIRTHFGVLFDEGRAAFRAYNYRVAFGVGVLFGGSAR